MIVAVIPVEKAVKNKFPPTKAAATQTKKSKSTQPIGENVKEKQFVNETTSTRSNLRSPLD